MGAVTPVRTGDPEFDSAATVLSLLPASKTAGRIQTDPAHIDWRAIEADCHSSTEDLLFKVALDMWNGTGHAHLGAMLHSLNARQWGAVLAALDVRGAALDFGVPA